MKIKEKEMKIHKRTELLDRATHRFRPQKPSQVWCDAASRLSVSRITLVIGATGFASAGETRDENSRSRARRYLC